MMIKRSGICLSGGLLFFLASIIVVTLLSFCSGIKDSRISIKQGVFGRVLWMQGNLMPSPDRPTSNGAKPVYRIVYIYSRITSTQTEGEAPLFSKIKGDLIAKVKTNKEGYFQCKLTPGRYSIFTLEEDGKFFANLFEGDGSITPFEVKAGEVTRYDISVNYKAAY